MYNLSDIVQNENGRIENILIEITLFICVCVLVYCILFL